METKEKKQRKVGSGFYERKPRLNCLKGSYKIYGLVDPDTKKIMYIGLTTQWLTKRLQYHIYCARVLKQHSKRDQWINSLLDKGKRPQKLLIERLTTNDETEAKKIENEYIKKYGVTNTAINTFKGVPIKKDRKPFMNQLTEMIKEGKSEIEISRETGKKQTIINYWLKKINKDKHSIMKEQNRWITELLKNGHTNKEIANFLNLSVECVYKRIKKYSLNTSAVSQDQLTSNEWENTSTSKK